MYTFFGVILSPSVFKNKNLQKSYTNNICQPIIFTVKDLCSICVDFCPFTYPPTPTKIITNHTQISLEHLLLAEKVRRKFGSDAESLYLCKQNVKTNQYLQE